MKITTQRTLFYRLLLGCVPFLFLVIGTACEKDAEENETPANLIGTWHQTSRSIDGIAIAKDSTRLIMQINEDNICILCDSTRVAVKAKTIVKRSGWDYAGNLLNIAIDLPASWTPVASANSLTIERVDFNQDGKLNKTILTYERVADMVIK
jgi:hypothetical protein